MRALIDAGANVNAVTPDGVRALHIAAYDLGETRLLLAAGGSWSTMALLAAIPEPPAGTISAAR